MDSEKRFAMAASLTLRSAKCKARGGLVDVTLVLDEALEHVVLLVGVLNGGPSHTGGYPSLPVRRRLLVAPELHVCHPIVIPRVKVEGANLGDVGPEVAMDAGALETDELAEIDACPRVLCHCGGNVRVVPPGVRRD